VSNTGVQEAFEERPTLDIEHLLIFETTNAKSQAIVKDESLLMKADDRVGNNLPAVIRFADKTAGSIFGCQRTRVALYVNTNDECSTPSKSSGLRFLWKSTPLHRASEVRLAVEARHQDEANVQKHRTASPHQMIRDRRPDSGRQ
jgi:hypothetical protein